MRHLFEDVGSMKNNFSEKKNMQMLEKGVGRFKGKKSVPISLRWKSRVTYSRRLLFLSLLMCSTCYFELRSFFTLQHLLISLGYRNVFFTVLFEHFLGVFYDLR